MSLRHRRGGFLSSNKPHTFVRVTRQVAFTVESITDSLSLSFHCDNDHDLWSTFKKKMNIDHDYWTSKGRVFSAHELKALSVRPSITFHIFDFSSESAEPNSTKLDRKQDLNILYQACVFRADRKNKMAALASDWLRHFWLLLWNYWTEFNETWHEARSQHPLPSLCLRADQKNKMAALASDWLRHFRLLLWNCWMEFNETWQEARSQLPLPSLCFLG